MAQAFRRLGAEVDLFHMGGHLLNREDPDAAALVQAAFEREGIRLHLGAKVTRVARTERGIGIHEDSADAPAAVVDALVVGTGRQRNVENLGLETAGVAYDPRDGIRVDDRLRTTNPRIYAAGDVCLPWQFTHAADTAARMVIQNALFARRLRVSDLVIPWCTYTDPEIGHIGAYPNELEERGVAFRTVRKPFAEVDRAVTDGETEGFAKFHVAPRSGRILGATVVARHAGDLLGEISVAMRAGMGLGELANAIHPYPTQAEALRQAGDLFNRGRLTPRVRMLFGAWRKAWRWMNG